MIRVLIVDDSAVVRRVLTDELSKHEGIEVVGSAIDPYVARDKILKLNPDVITLDIEMPRMDGLSFLETLMRHHPIPVVIVSSLTPNNSDLALRALSLGAVEVVGKPGSAFSTPDIARQLAHAIRAAASARITQLTDATSSPSEPNYTKTMLRTTHRIIAIGASTGGPQAIETVLKGLPGTSPGTVIVQHMPQHFTASFAARLNLNCAMEVREAKDGDAVVPGLALVAPGNEHMLLAKSGARYYVQVRSGPPVHHQRPAVDVLFQSVARNAGANAVGVLLTGMGADGAKGLVDVKATGAYTIAQDEATCIVYGMPREAVRMNAVDAVLPLPQIAGAVIRALS